VLVAGNARVLAEAVGSPPTWPASWLFAWQHDTSPARYDGLVGRYLFYRQNNRGGRILTAAPDDEPMLGEGWGRVESKDGEEGRRVRGRARVFAPLDQGEDLEVKVRATRDRGWAKPLARERPEAGRLAVGPGWSEPRLRSPRPSGAGVNEVAIEDPEETLLVGAFVFTRSVTLAAPGGGRS
jgi:hypothetical protein